MFAEPTTGPQGSLRRYHGAHEPHVHDHAQVLLGVQGALELEIDGVGARVDSGSGLIVPAGARHAFESRSGARVWVIDATDHPGLDRLRRFALWHGWSMQAPPSVLLSLAGAAPRRLPRRCIDAARLEARVRAALHEDWPVARMAGVFAMSAPRFHARWAELTGSTPQAWLRQQRLEVAARLLRAGRSLDAAALAVGYRSASALAFALRRDLGASARGLRTG